MKRPSRRRVPDAQGLLKAASALKACIPSKNAACSLRRSFNGVPNLRYAAETNGRRWLVDIYQGNYYRVQVGDGIGEVFRSIPPLLGYLVRSLEIVREPSNPVPEEY